jgi:hypothetical protein
MTTEIAAADVHLFPPRPVSIIQRWKHESYSAQRVFAGPNPPDGAVITYHLKADSKGPAAITIRNASGTVVRELSGTTEAGFNRIIWDLRSEAPAVLTGARGPFVVPGTYRVTVRAAGRESSATVKVDPDPALPVTDAERQLRFQFLTDALQVQAALAGASNDLRSVRDQIAALQEQLKRESSPVATLNESSARLLKTLTALQARVGGGGGGGGEEGGGGGGNSLRGRANNLFSALDGSGIHQGTLSGPTVAQRQQLEALQKDAQAFRSEIDRALGADLAALNDEIGRAKIPRITRPKQ